MIRKIVGVILGLVGAVLTIAIIERLAHRWLGPGAGGQDLKMLLAVLLAWFMGGLVGAWIATLMDPARGRVPALCVTSLLLVVTVANLMSYTHPAWFWAAGIGVYLPATWFGIRAAKPYARKR